MNKRLTLFDAVINAIMNKKNIVSRVLVGCSTLVDNSEAMRVPFDTYTRFFVLVELNDPGEPAVS